MDAASRGGTLGDGRRGAVAEHPGREARAEIAKRLQYAKDNEEDIRAQYRGSLYSELEIAVKAAYAEYVQHAQTLAVMAELEHDLEALVGPKGRGFWKQPTTPPRARRPTKW